MVRIDQPPANKVTVAAFVAVGGYVLLILLSELERTPFSALLAITLMAILLYGWRVFRITAIGTYESLVVRNLLSSSEYAWTEIASMTVGPSPRGGGFGINLQLADATIVPVEASWGAWYLGRGKLSTNHAETCQNWIEDLRRVATTPPPKSEAS